MKSKPHAFPLFLIFILLFGSSPVVFAEDTPQKDKQTFPKVTKTKNGDYKVRLWNFETRELAEDFRFELLQKGLSPIIEQKGNRWELFTGPYPSEGSALEAKSSICIVTLFSVVFYCH